VSLLCPVGALIIAFIIAEAERSIVLFFSLSFGLPFILCGFFVPVLIIAVLIIAVLIIVVVPVVLTAAVGVGVRALLLETLHIILFDQLTDLLLIRQANSVLVLSDPPQELTRIYLPILVKVGLEKDVLELPACNFNILISAVTEQLPRVHGLCFNQFSVCIFIASRVLLTSVIGTQFLFLGPLFSPLPLHGIVLGL